MKLRNKLILIYFVIGIVPMILIVFVSTYLMGDILREKEEQNIKTYLTQTINNVDSELMAFNKLSQYISFNTTISQVFTSDYDNSYDLYKEIVSVIQPQLDTVIYFGDIAKRATIYADIRGKKYDTIVVPLKEIQDEYWYRDVCRDIKSHWYVDRENGTAFCASRIAILKQQGMVGIFYVEIDYDMLFEDLSNMGKNYGVFITDENNEVVYSTSKFEDKYAKYELRYDEFMKLDNESEYTILSENLNEATWKIWMYKHEESIISDTKPIKILATLVIVVCTVTLFLGMIWLGRFITSRIMYLRRGMVAAESGDFTLRLEVMGEDEIGELIHGYNTLLGKIQALITEVYESEIAQKKYEMKALQNQINPHFLYNSLSLINWKAIENDNSDISDITLALSKFYRTSLNKGRNTLSISDEISNVKSYIAIQLVMHDNEFDVEYDIAPEILSYETLNLILQPIVENAIEHGIEVMGDNKRGYIIIKGWMENDCVYISVTDNGVGMDAEKAANIITQHSKGYGIRNVNERIRLFYGEQYGLSVCSEIDKGTTITVCIPVREM